MKITIIDDDEISTFVTNKVLLKHDSKKEVTTYLSPLDGLNNFKKMNHKDLLPDLILLDLNMPKLNGFEFLDELYKSNDIFKKIKICILTSSTNKSDYEKSENYNSIIAFITKPLSIDSFDKLSDKLSK